MEEDYPVIVDDVENMNFDDTFFGCYIQYIGKHGKINDLKKISNYLSEFDIKFIVGSDLLALAILEKPALSGCEVVVGTSQRFGIPLGFGGPHAGYFATKNSYKRHIPGRIIGISKDRLGNKALRMALQTREQHIKRERATCAAQVLLAVMAGMYAVYHGPKGLKSIAQKINDLCSLLNNNLRNLGIEQLNKSFFDTLHIKTDSIKLKKLAVDKKINFNYINNNEVSISLNEATEIEDVELIFDIISSLEGQKINFDKDAYNNNSVSQFERKSTFLEDKIFNTHHSETSMMRYIKSLERKDLSLNHSMISLGSCTMKLNAAAEMLPLSWKKWNNIHPFAPNEQVKGYIEILNTLEQQLNEITGFHSTTLQPNSGAQGEYTGLMLIRAYFKSINQDFI